MVRTNKICILKKVILFLFGFMLTSLAFSQCEGYYTAFQFPSLFETQEWTVSDNRCFKVDSETYVLSFEPFNRKNPYDRDIYLYRKVADDWVKASSVIRHDYFHFVDSIQVLDEQANKYNIRDGKSMCYGTINIGSKGIVTIGIMTWIFHWKRNEPLMQPIYEDLILTPKGDKTYDFTIKSKK